MRSLLDYSNEELEKWVTDVRADREAKRNTGLQTFRKAKAETRAKVERKAKSQGIEVVDMSDIMAAFLKS